MGTCFFGAIIVILLLFLYFVQQQKNSRRNGRNPLCSSRNARNRSDRNRNRNRNLEHWPQQKHLVTTSAVWLPSYILLPQTTVIDHSKNWLSQLFSLFQAN